VLSRASIGYLFLIVAAAACSGAPENSGSVRGLDATHPPLRLAFGTYTADKPTDVVDQFRPLLNRLTQKLSVTMARSVEIRMQIAPTYEDGLADLVTGRVDIARFGPASYVVAHEANPGISLLAIELTEGKTSFRGVICVHRDSDIESIEMLAGRRFAFGSERSTVGRYLAQQLLADHGVSAERLQDWAYLDRHDRVGAAVAARQFDAGALKESTFKKLVARGEPIRELAAVVVVTKPWLAREGLAADIKSAISTALLEIDREGQLEGSEFDGFVAGDDARYDSVRRAIEGSERFFEQSETLP
jgi:phosphonate transport system substrate-binding protein